MLTYVSQRDVQRLSYIIQYSFQGYAQQFQTHPNNFFMSIVNIANVSNHCIKAILYLKIWCFEATNYRHFDILAVGID